MTKTQRKKIIQDIHYQKQKKLQDKETRIILTKWKRDEGKHWNGEPGTKNLKYDIC